MPSIRVALLLGRRWRCLVPNALFSRATLKTSPKLKRWTQRRGVTRYDFDGQPFQQPAGVKNYIRVPCKQSNTTMRSFSHALKSRHVCTQDVGIVRQRSIDKYIQRKRKEKRCKSLSQSIQDDCRVNTSTVFLRNATTAEQSSHLLRGGCRDYIFMVLAKKKENEAFERTA